MPSKSNDNLSIYQYQKQSNAVQPDQMYVEGKRLNFIYNPDMIDLVIRCYHGGEYVVTNPLFLAVFNREEVFQLTVQPHFAFQAFLPLSKSNTFSLHTVFIVLAGGQFATIGTPRGRERTHSKSRVF